MVYVFDTEKEIKAKENAGFKEFFGLSFPAGDFLAEEMRNLLTTAGIYNIISSASRQKT